MPLPPASEQASPPEKARFATIDPRLLAFGTGGLVLILYALTAAPDLSTAFHSSDGGELIAAAATLGIPHPPGAPLYIFLGRLLSAVPLGLLAARFNLLSSLMMAVAAGAIVSTASTLTRGRAIQAAAAGLLFALTPLVWQQAVIAEVYALQAGLLGLSLLAAARQSHPILSGLLAGLAVTTHPTAVFSLPLLLSLQPRRQWIQIGSGFLFPQILWLALPLLTRGPSPIAWGDPTTLRGWWWLVSGELYRPNLQGLNGANFSRFIAAFTASHPGGWLALGGWLAGVPGLAFLDRQNRPKGTLTVFLTGLAYLAFSLAYDSQDSAVYVIPGLLMLAPWLAAGWLRLKFWLILLPAALLALNFHPIYIATREILRPEVAPLLAGLPEKALVITDGRDETIFPVWFFHVAEGLRPDLAVVDRNLFAFDWYRRRLERFEPGLGPLNQDDLPGLIESQKPNRPICFLGLAPTQLNCNLPND